MKSITIFGRCLWIVFIYIVYNYRILLLEVDWISKQMSRWFYLSEKFNENNMMAFCNINCLRKSSRIIVIPTTSVNVLWDAIVPLSATPTLIDQPFAKHRNSFFRNTSVVFPNINNKRHISYSVILATIQKLFVG
jgi:hypothetical protein